MSAALTKYVPLAFLAGLRLLPAQTQYTTDGTPTVLEEEIRWHTNRARFDRNAENTNRKTSFTDVPLTGGPFAPNESLAVAARHHSEDMAKKNKFQHETVPGSAYYNANTQPQPWDRFAAEGYFPYAAVSENIAAGYETPEAAFVGWWNSSGHRVNLMGSAYREIGNGYYFWASSQAKHYWTMDLGSRADAYFTDTLFNDANGNGKYTQGEGVGNIRVSLRVNGAEHSFYDISTGVGSFAVPDTSIARGTTVEVWLTNQNGGPVTLSIPRDYTTLEAMTLAAGESRSAGTAAHPGGSTNFGFRNLTKAAAVIPVPVLSLNRSGAAFAVSWPSQSGIQYLAQWSANLSTWTDFPAGYQNGTGGQMTQTDTPGSGTARRYYRVVARRP